jgi:glycosyltransferase 2 family protein
MRDKLPGMYDAIVNADRMLIAVGFILCLLVVYFIALRLKRVISVQSLEISAKESVYLSFIGYFFNNFLPTSFGGDLLKAYYAGKKSNNQTGAFAGVFMDRVLAMIPFTFIPVVTITFFSHRISNRPLIAMVYIIFLISAVFAWMILHKNTTKYFSLVLNPFKESLWYEKIKSGYGLLNLYSKHMVVLLWSLFLSVVAQGLSVIAVYIFARALGVYDIGLGVFFIIVPIIGIMTIVPSINGLGIREGAYVYLLSPYMSSEKALALSVLVFASLLMYSIIGGFIYGFQKNAFSFQANLK